MSIVRLILILIMTIAIEDLVMAGVRPEFDGPAYASQVSNQIRARRRSLRTAMRDQSISSDQKVINGAMDQYLLLAETLLNRGDRIKGMLGSRMVTQGVAMLDGFASIELLLRPYGEGRLEPRKAEQVRSDLLRFTQAVRAGLSRIPLRGSVDLDAIMAELLGPLRSACELVSKQEAPAGWWRMDDRIQSSEGDALADAELDEIEIDQDLRSEIEQLGPRASSYSSDRVGHQGQIHEMDQWSSTTSHRIGTGFGDEIRASRASRFEPRPESYSGHGCSD